LLNHLIPDNTHLQEWSTLIQTVNNKKVKPVIHDDTPRITQAAIPKQVEGATVQSVAAHKSPERGSGSASEWRMPKTSTQPSQAPRSLSLRS